MKKIRVGILFGGRSAEHEVSLQSAKNVISSLDKKKYEPVLIGIGKDGTWFFNDTSHFLLNADNPALIALNHAHNSVALVPGKKDEQLVSFSQKTPHQIDVIFPVLHGPFGEDGTVQGLLKLTDIPFVGAGVLGSAVGMDKDVMKRLLRDAGIPIAKFMTVTDSNAIFYKEVVKKFGVPFFVKPANLGSSVGVKKVHDKKELENALSEAFSYDRKVLIEEAIKGREIECSVLGNENPIASMAGEVVPKHEFYDYDAKYIDEHGADLLIPAKVSETTMKKIQNMAIQAFQVLCCEGMARVDFFLTEDDKIYVNEINTIPGFTKISMYPKLWAASGMSYTQLIDRLITLALDRFEKEKQLKTNK